MTINNYDRKQLLECIAHRIRTGRKKNNLSIEQLAELSNVSPQTIKDIEYAKRACQIDTFVSITTALHLSTDFVLGILDYSSDDTAIKFETIYDTLNDKQKDILLELAKIVLKKMP